MSMTAAVATRTGAEAVSARVLHVLSTAGTEIHGQVTAQLSSVGSGVGSFGDSATNDDMARLEENAASRLVGMCVIQHKSEGLSDDEVRFYIRSAWVSLDPGLAILGKLGAGAVVGAAIKSLAIAPTPAPTPAPAAIPGAS